MSYVGEIRTVHDRNKAGEVGSELSHNLLMLESLVQDLAQLAGREILQGNLVLDWPTLHQ